jgi:MOSC domain-containing protein YiiM
VRVVSVNLGDERVLAVGARRVRTGIAKHPVAGAHVGEYGLAGDLVADEENHGGRDQAVYLYGEPDYDFWREQTGRALEPGVFGENLTLSDLRSTEVRVGDRFGIGEVVLEATAPRIPCGVFASWLEEPAWVKRFAAARRPGVYARVLAEGVVAVGDEVDLEAAPHALPLLVELVDAHYDARPPRSTVERLLAAPLAARAREELTAKLALL